MEAESYNSSYRSKEVQEMDRCWSKDTKLRLNRMSKYKDVTEHEDSS